MEQGPDAPRSPAPPTDETTDHNGDITTAETEANDANNATKKKCDKKHQYTVKQRMDMYAFCVLEMETNGNKVSIKKQQQAVQKVIQSKLEQLKQQNASGIASTGQGTSEGEQASKTQQRQQSISNPNTELQPDQQQTQSNSNNVAGNVRGVIIISRLQDHNYGASSQNNAAARNAPNTSEDLNKSLMDMEIELTYCNYSDFQKTQVLTAQMLRGVQRRFSKYYPECPPPSRTTIKHVFEKCVEHGTVDNIRRRRKAVKIPQGDEITNLLVQEPQLSLRQMARRLNVSTGTVSRRCKALGLVPNSVTAKHHQLAMAKRQRQLKQIEDELKSIAQAKNSSSSGPQPSSSRVYNNSRSKQVNKTN